VGFFLTQSVGENPIRIADEGSVVRRRAPLACEAVARRDAFERSVSLPPSAPKRLSKNYPKSRILGSLFPLSAGFYRLFP